MTSTYVHVTLEDSLGYVEVGMGLGRGGLVRAKLGEL